MHTNARMQDAKVVKKRCTHNTFGPSFLRLRRNRCVKEILFVSLYGVCIKPYERIRWNQIIIQMPYMATTCWNL